MSRLKVIASFISASIATFCFATAWAADSNDEGVPTKPATAAEKGLAAVVLKVDSEHWTRMTYDPRTLRNFYTYDNSRGSHYIHTEFKYETPDGPGWGWADIRAENNKVRCVIYWDSHDACNEYRSPEYYEAYIEREMQRRRDEARCGPAMEYGWTDNNGQGHMVPGKRCN